MGKTKQQGSAANSRTAHGVTVQLDGYTGPFPTAEQEVAYCRSILSQAGVRPGEMAVIAANCAEVVAASPSFAVAAADLGIEVAIIDHRGQSKSNQEMEAQARAMERVAGGQGVHIAVISMNGVAGQPLPEHPDSQRMMATAPGQDPESDRRQADIERFNQAMQQWNQGLAENKTKWSETRWPTEQWAEIVFPDIAASRGRQAALSALTAIIQQATLANDPAGQKAKQERMIRRAAALNDPVTGASRFSQIKISSEPASNHPDDIGTELIITIADDSAFASVYVQDSDDRTTSLNYPAEEVYTTPHRQKVQGHFTTSRPYVSQDDQGQAAIVNGLVGRFDSQGQMNLTAFNAAEQWILDRDFNDQGPAPTNVLSELGLVDCSGPLAQSGRVFHDTMLDESSGIHLGSGSSHVAYTGGRRDQVAPPTGPHRDLVIGHQGSTVIGVDDQGAETTIIYRGSWQDQWQ